MCYHIGIIIPQGWLGDSWRTAIEDVAKYNGIPVLNLYSDTKIPPYTATLDGSKVCKKDMNTAISITVTSENIVSPTNLHPNIKCHQKMSCAIEEFLQNL